MEDEMSETKEHFDVLIVGAGISGISAGYHLQTMSPNKSWAILEARENLGGTWDLFRYPGIRSDSDMHTLGFRFKPWKQAKSIADGPAILEYLEETVTEYDIREKIKFGHSVSNASWSSKDSNWTLEIHTADSDQPKRLSCNFLYMCSGYYSYKGGFTPDFNGVASFKGKVVHPQDWPEDLDYADKEVVVIGSGATAMTLVPAMASTAKHVTMLQRSPTYVVSRPDEDRVANFLRKVLPDKVAYWITRKKNIFRQGFVYKKTRTKPDEVKKLLLQAVQEELGEDYDIEKHFTPAYNPWDQRLCLLPNGDLFKSIKSGDASVVTEHIDSFVEDGLLLTSGEVLKADIIVTATGLQLVTLGEMDFFVDGVPLDFSKTWTYKGVAYSDVPNLASCFGYVNASWTLKADLTSEYVCRLLNHMEETDSTQCTPRLREEDGDMPQRQWIEDFPAGYMQRMMPLLPRQGDREPWLHTQDFQRDIKLISKASVDDGVMMFTNPQSDSLPSSGHQTEALIS